MFEATATERFTTLEPYMAARGYVPGGPFGLRPPGAELGAIREAAGDVRDAVVRSGTPDAVTTCDLITLPYPTRFGLFRAGRSPAPFLWFVNRMLVVQWTEPDGTSRTMLWEPSDHERGQFTPYYDGLIEQVPLSRERSRTILSTTHGTVLGHLRALGIEPEDVDYLAFDHLHTQDVRRHLGTRRPVPELGSPAAPLPPWFANAKLVVQVREWETIRHLHPIQAPWYQPRTYDDLQPESLLFVDGDLLLGPGVGLLFTPGHTAGNMSLLLNTDEGVWASSENGIAAECWAPEASRIPGVSTWSREWGQEVVLNANVLEFTAWQYDSMVAERLVVDWTADGDFPLMFPSSELSAHPLSPLVRPTHVHGAIRHGHIRASDVRSSGRRRESGVRSGG
jgi:hypothetical protein